MTPRSSTGWVGFDVCFYGPFNSSINTGAAPDVTYGSVPLRYGSAPVQTLLVMSIYNIQTNLMLFTQEQNNYGECQIEKKEV